MKLNNSSLFITAQAVWPSNLKIRPKMNNSSHFLFQFLVLVYTFLSISLTSGTLLVLVNNCNETVWPGILGGAGHLTPRKGGFRLGPGEEVAVNVPHGWSGRVWGRQGCCFDQKGKGSCESGDCAGLLHCMGTGGALPATVVEMTFGTPKSALHYYDVTLVDGFNMPVSMMPAKGSGRGRGHGGGGGCSVAACKADLNVGCPAMLQLRKGSKVVGCKSACTATKLDRYCCTGEYASPKRCKPTLFAHLFKAYCPSAYSFAYDDSSSLHSCQAARYLITFCPPTK